MKKIERIWHPWQKWECYKNGFFGPFKNGMTKNSGEIMYAEFFSRGNLFEENLSIVMNDWKYSLEHNLTNSGLNKVAWCGQAAACVYKGIPAECRSGLNFLSEKDRIKNNKIVEGFLLEWFKKGGYELPENLY